MWRTALTSLLMSWLYQVSILLLWIEENKPARIAMTAKGAMAISSFRRSLRFASRPILDQLQWILRSDSEIRSLGGPLAFLGHVIQFASGEQASIRIGSPSRAIRATAPPIQP